ncbi:MAG TPA: LD-carboxypeptidase [Candidatus Paceibacterota bacterium]|nr:LD-carboxypeptidase [Verrucomicrobiota bacterium]HSA11173.1 LD-carboxypeptidase [Candidatus Paceibacterota bacterium]
MPAIPDRLHPGDTIGIVAPASAPPDPKNVDRSVAALERLGFKPKLAPNVRRRWGFLAGSDRDRAGDLMRMFADRKVKAIICVRGGYGSSRLLPLLDYRVIRANPKIFVGYSDITSLHCAFLLKAGLVSFHGPMLNSDIIKQDMPGFTLRSFLKTLMQPTAPGSICDGYRRKTVTVLRPGVASGPLVGGNITLLCAALGTPYLPDFKKRILFFEDLDEVPYRFDRMLTQLLNAGLLQQVAGIAIGINAGCKDPKARYAREYRQTLEDVFRERLLPLKVPLVTGLPFGHIPLNATLPIGVRVTLDAVKGDLRITQPAVK